jgi:hypothetical protein
MRRRSGFREHALETLSVSSLAGEQTGSGPNGVVFSFPDRCCG